MGPIEKFGEEGAFQKAVELRQKMEKKAYGRVVQNNIPSFDEVKLRLEKALKASRRKKRTN